MWLTNEVNEVTVVCNDENAVRVAIAHIEDIFSKIKIVDEEICELYSNVELRFQEIDPEIDGQNEYSLNLSVRLEELKSIMRRPAVTNTSSNVGPAVGDNTRANFDLKLPTLNCPVFTGENTNSNEFFSFMNHFNNVIGNRPNLNKSTKFTYLKTYLRGYALKVVQHLHITEENYDVALAVLDREFLDREAIVDELMHKIFSMKPEFDSSFLKTKMYINDVKCIISDLNQYEHDIMNNRSSLRIVSHIVASHLPDSFKQELSRKTGKSFPCLTDIFLHYVDVIRTLNMRHTRTQPVESEVTKPETSGIMKSYNETLKRLTNINHNSNHKSHSRSQTRQGCKFCVGEHSMLKCRQFNSLAKRIARCNELGMCTLCTSAEHTEKGCRGKLDFECFICKSNNHVAALCPKFKSTTNN